MRRLLVVVMLLIPVIAWCQESKKRESVKKVNEVKKGDCCPGFIFKDTEGKEVSLKQFKKKYVVIDVWASWCHPCKQEYPTLKKIAEKYKNRNIVFVSISCDHQEQRWRNELGWGKMTGYQWWIAGDNSFIFAFQVSSIPRLILLDKKGRVVDLKLPKPSEPQFEKILSELKGV